MNHGLHPPRSSTPFFRTRTSFSSSSTSASSSSSSGSDSGSSDSSSGDDDDQDDDSYWSSSGASASSSPFKIERFPHLKVQPTPSPRPSPTAQPRSSLKLSLSYLRARQSLSHNSFESLSQSLRTLSTLLPSSSSSASTSWDSIPIFIPILYRFIHSLDSVLNNEETTNKEFRRTILNKEDSKALISIKQRWNKLSPLARKGEGEKGKGKGKAKESELDWVEYVLTRVEKNPPPSFLVNEEKTSALLNSLESVLLPSCSIPRLSLSNLNLSSRQLRDWHALERLDQVVEWYLSFVPSGRDSEEEATKRRREEARAILKGIKSLDLSRNRLTSFPPYLPHLFPSLETLSLSHNLFPHFPPSITLFSNLRRLRTHGNRLVSDSTKMLESISSTACREKHKGRKRESGKNVKGTRANSRRIIHSILTRDRSIRAATTLTKETRVPSLFRISTELLLLLPPSLSPSSSRSSPITDPLPPHLLEILSKSYICSSCRSTILYDTPEDGSRYFGEEVFERVHFVEPGIRVPKPTTTKSSSSTLVGGQRDLGGSGEGEGEGEGGGSGERSEMASLEQILLLTLYNRFDSQPPPPPAPRTTLSKTSRKRNKDFGERGSGLPTLIIGGTPSSEPDDEAGGKQEEEGIVRGRNDWKFCFECARLHLGIETPAREGFRGHGGGGGGQQRKKCGCFVCDEERRVRGEGDDQKGQGEGEGEGEERVLRWLRRRERVKRTEFAREGA